MKFKKYHSTFLHIFLFAVAVSVGLVIGEFAARAFHLSKTFNSYPWRIHAGRTLPYSPEKNSHGWRDREFSETKKKGTFRIACIGDSVTEGYNVEFDNAFPKIMEKGLRNINRNVEVMNLGKSGNNTSDNLSNLKSAMKFDPDLIVYQFGMNDIESFEHMERASPQKDAMVTGSKQARSKKKFSFKSLLRKSVLYLALAERYNYLKLKMGRRNWAFDEWDIKDAMWEKEFAKLKKAFNEVRNNSRILVIYMPYDFQVYSTRDEVFIPARKLSKFCKDNRYDFIDFTRVFKNQKNKYSLFLDDCHLSDYGNKVAAEYLKDFFYPSIRN